MKTAIITLPFHVNYGGYLQAYALQTVLKQMGHKAYVISFSQQPTWRIWISYLKWKILRLVRNNYGVEDSFKDFFMLKINKKFFRTINDIRESDFEAYVVGSDQVWRKKFIKNLPYAYLAFTKGWNVKRIAYAPSFGITEWDYTDEETSMCRSLINSFDSISVRETSGADLCEEYFNRTPFVALDPTLIAEKSVYMRLLNKSIKNVGTFIYYVKKNEAALDINEVLKALDCKKHKEVYLPCDGYSTDKLPTVPEWLSYIANADLVLTDSFHACVFCMLFHKPFLVMPSGWGGKSRFETLLAPLGLENHILTTLPSEKQMSVFSKKINWNDVDAKINEKRKASLSFLKELF